MATNQLIEEMQKLSRRDLHSVFYVGRKLRLVDCYLGKTDQLRTVAEQRSFGYVMEREDGRKSEMRLSAGDTILGSTFSLGYTHISIIDAQDKLAAKYELL